MLHRHLGMLLLVIIVLLLITGCRASCRACSSAVPECQCKTFNSMTIRCYPTGRQIDPSWFTGCKQKDLQLLAGVESGTTDQKSEGVSTSVASSEDTTTATDGGKGVLRRWATPGLPKTKYPVGLKQWWEIDDRCFTHLAHLTKLVIVQPISIQSAAFRTLVHLDELRIVWDHLPLLAGIAYEPGPFVQSTIAHNAFEMAAKKPMKSFRILINVPPRQTGDIANFAHTIALPSSVKLFVADTEVQLRKLPTPTRPAIQTQASASASEALSPVTAPSDEDVPDSEASHISFDMPPTDDATVEEASPIIDDVVPLIADVDLHAEPVVPLSPTRTVSMDDHDDEPAYDQDSPPATYIEAPQLEDVPPFASDRPNQLEDECPFIASTGDDVDLVHMTPSNGPPEQDATFSPRSAIQADSDAPAEESRPLPAAPIHRDIDAPPPLSDSQPARMDASTTSSELANNGLPFVPAAPHDHVHSDVPITPSLLPTGPHLHDGEYPGQSSHSQLSLPTINAPPLADHVVSAEVQVAGDPLPPPPVREPFLPLATLKAVSLTQSTNEIQWRAHVCTPFLLAVIFTIFSIVVAFEVRKAQLRG